MANEEVKLNDELNVIQLPEANSEALDGVNQVFVTRYGMINIVYKLFVSLIGIYCYDL